MTWKINAKTIGPALLVAVGGIAALSAQGCDEIADAQGALCCEEGDFQVGGSISAEAGYSAEVKVALQAVADIGGIASAAVDDLTTACRAMAEDLDADAQARKDAAAIEDKTARMEATCNLAVTAIADFKAKAGASLTVNFDPPQCSANVSAKASCQGGCSASAECDIKANPPTCEGGKLSVSCKGGCTGEAGASVSCTGSCSAECSGKCTVTEGSVECNGKCDGTCEATAEAGSGIQADGTCNGNCSGTCEATAPGATCSGSCEGTCSATCQGSAEASVECDGSCDGEFEPLKCEGGELKGGCQVDAKCEANCDASVKAKAECTPPQISVEFAAGANAEFAGKLKAALEANLGLVAVLEVRLTALADATAVVVGNVNADFLAEIKVACIPVVLAALEGAAGDLEATVSASASIMGQIGG